MLFVQVVSHGEQVFPRVKERCASKSWFATGDIAALEDLIGRLRRLKENLGFITNRVTTLQASLDSWQSEQINKSLYYLSFLSIVFLPLSIVTGGKLSLLLVIVHIRSSGHFLFRGCLKCWSLGYILPCYFTQFSVWMSVACRGPSRTRTPRIWMVSSMCWLYALWSCWFCYSASCSLRCILMCQHGEPGVSWPGVALRTKGIWNPSKATEKVTCACDEDIAGKRVTAIS